MLSNPAPTFVHYLKQLKKILDIIECHYKDSPDILHSTLHADMLPFIAQVRTAANFSLRTCCPMTGRAYISFQNSDASFPGLHQQIDSTVNYLETLTDEDFKLAPAILHDKAGFNDLSLPTFEFLNFYALPNFFFHLSTAYAIARHAGIPLSKADFDGYHHYPAGFSFVNNE